MANSREQYAVNIHNILGHMENLFIQYGQEMHEADPAAHARVVAANYLLSSAIPNTPRLNGFDGEIHD